jgi:DNA polymerase-3 subunit beta
VKFTAQREDLAHAVSWAARALPARPASPILAGMRVHAESELTVSAYDYDTSAQACLPFQAGEGGTAIVPGRLFADIVRSLPPKPVDLATDGARLTIRCGSATFTLMLLPEEQYPSPPDLPPLAGTVSGGWFATAASQAATAASKEDSLATLTAARLEIADGKLTLAATDRYRLAITDIPWTPAQPGVTAAVLVPAHVLLDAAKATAGAAQVAIHLATHATENSGLAGFQASGLQTTFRLISGDFPPYQSLIPTEFTGVAQIQAAAFTGAIKRVALVAQRDTAIRLCFGKDHVELEAGAGEEAQATETLEASFDGQPGFQISFKPNFLLDGLAGISADAVTMSFTQPNKAALLAGNTGDQPGYRYLLMPVRRNT